MDVAKVAAAATVAANAKNLKDVIRSAEERLDELAVWFEEIDKNIPDSEDKEN